MEEKLNLNNLTEIAKILDLSIEELESNHKKLESYNATYYWNPAKGGISIIVDSNGEYLGATSSVNFDRLLEEFKSGRRNGKITNAVFTSYSGMNSSDIKKLIEEKMELLKDKLNGKIDNQEKENAGYLFWNCKIILRNVYMACDKLTNKFKDELSDEVISDLIKKSNVIKDNEANWKNMDDIKTTYNLLLNDTNSK